MSSHRNRHKCINHPAAIARGKCVKCGAWICSSCTNFKNGQFFCKNNCVRKPADAVVPQIKPVLPALEPTVIVTKQKSPVRFQPVWFAVIVSALFGLGGILLALFTQNTVSSLSSENDSLAVRVEKLDGQVTHVQDALRLLLEQQRQAQTLQEQPGKIRNQPSFDNLPDRALTNGLPVSLDNGPTDKKLVSLTFDGSSLDNVAAEILDTLGSRNVKATFFLTGTFLNKFPDMVRRILNDGHEVGNHTFNHPHLTTFALDRTQTTLPDVTETFLRNELEKVSGMFYKLTGKNMSPLWRSPYGEYNRTLCLWAQKAGFLHVGWRQGSSWRRGLDSNDWVPDEETEGYHLPQEVYEKIMALAREQPSGINGGIILMHCGSERKERDKQVQRILGKLIDDLRGLGYEFMPVTALAAEAGINLDILKNRQSGN